MNKKIKCEIYRDSMQNFRRYGIPKAQLIIADVPYCVGTNFYGSNPAWYVGGDSSNVTTFRLSRVCRADEGGEEFHTELDRENPRVEVEIEVVENVH